METFFVFLDESRCYRQKRDLTADFRIIVSLSLNVIMTKFLMLSIKILIADEEYPRVIR